MITPSSCCFNKSADKATFWQCVTCLCGHDYIFYIFGLRHFFSVSTFLGTDLCWCLGFLSLVALFLIFRIYVLNVFVILTRQDTRPIGGWGLLALQSLWQKPKQLFTLNSRFPQFYELVWDGYTDCRTVIRTDGRTHPLIEMRSRI